jgi:hypothetical protein
MRSWRPSAKIQCWLEQTEDKQDREAVRSFAYDLGLTLKKYLPVLLAHRLRFRGTLPIVRKTDGLVN